jgi:hypothetical protein
MPGSACTFVGGNGRDASRAGGRPRGQVVPASDASHFYKRDRPFAILRSIPAMYRPFDRINELPTR